MPKRLLDFIDSSRSDSSRRSGGLLDYIDQQRSQSNDSEELQQRISNASMRLSSVGQELPQPEDHATVLDRIFNVLNFFNNKKNQTLSYLGGNSDAFSHDVTGADLLQQWGMNEGTGNQVAGFGFDLLTDPLNLLSFGTAGALNAGAKAGIKGAKAGTEALNALEAGSKAGSSVRNGQTVAKLGAHIPFTNIGASFDVPGSGAVLNKLGEIVKGATSKADDFIFQKSPELHNIGANVKNMAGKLFVRGFGVPKAVSAITKQTQDLIRMDTQDVINNVVNIRKGWEENYGHTFDNDIKIIKAIEDPTQFQNLTEGEAGVFNEVKDFFDANFVKAQEFGVVNDFIQNYIPHIFKGKKEEVEAALEQLRRKGPKVTTNSPFGQQRNLMADIAQILENPDLANKLKPETNLSKIMGIYKISLEKAIRNRDMLDNLVALGPDIIMHSSPTMWDPTLDGGKGGYRKFKIPVPEGWVKSPVIQLKDYYVAPEIGGHLKDILEPFNNNVAFEKLMSHMDGVLNWWKGMATVPNIGFHMRNMMGNLFNNYLGGVRDIESYRLAKKAQMAEDFTIDDFYNLFRSVKPMEPLALPSADGASRMAPILGGTGIGDRDIILERIRNDERFSRIMLGGDGPKIKVNFGDGKPIEVNMTGIKFLAKLHGVTGRGFFSGDIAEDIMKRLEPTKTSTKFNPFSRGNIGFQAAERLGTRIEDNARLAHFINKLKSGLPLNEASNSVKKYLFDYTNLTPVEKNVLRRVMPFYSFTRFNLPLQLKELVKQPKYATVMGKFQNFTEAWAEEETGTPVDKDSLPRYLNDLYSVRLPFQVGGKDVKLGIDLPIRDVNTFQSFSDVFTSLSPLITVPMEQITNRNVYFDKEIEQYEGQTVRAPGYLQGIFEVVKTLDPTSPYSQNFQRIAGAMGLTVGIDPETGNSEVRIPPRTAHYLNQIVALKNVGKLAEVSTGTARDPFAISSFLTGVTAHSSTLADRNRSVQFQQLQALEDLIRKLRDEGQTIPTVRDLQ